MIDERVWLDLAPAVRAVATAVAEPQALRVAAGSVNVAELNAATRRRNCAGRICSSLTSARTAVSSMPVTEARAAVRRPTAMAIASSSSSSSGGMARPARSRYPPEGPVSESTG
jgi:hypothetical protein